MTMAALPLLLAAAAGGGGNHTSSRRLQSGGAATAVYFGSGCYWHTQYDMYMAETEPTGPFARTDDQVTAKVGYAGGFGQGPGGRVCYHSRRNLPGCDYNILGHAETTQVLLDDGPDREAQFNALLVAFWEEFGAHMTRVSFHRPADEGVAAQRYG